MIRAAATATWLEPGSAYGDPTPPTPLTSPPATCGILIVPEPVRPTVSFSVRARPSCPCPDRPAACWNVPEYAEVMVPVPDRPPAYSHVPVTAAVIDPEPDRAAPSEVPVAVIDPEPDRAAAPSSAPAPVMVPVPDRVAAPSSAPAAVIDPEPDRVAAPDAVVNGE